jgi:hypothetical protein
VLDGRGADFTRDDQERFERHTGRTRPPTERPAEMVIIKGRRCGGTDFMGAKTIRAASFRRYALSPGERAVCSCSSADREQARVLFGYATAPYREVESVRGQMAPRPAWQALRDMVVRETRWAIDLVGGVSIEVSTADYRRLRGRTLVDANDDEIAFWVSAEDGANPAAAIVAAQRPALATQGGQ